MNIISPNSENFLQEVVKTLQDGGLIIFPTETCYGVGVDAQNSQAVSKLLEYKKRPEGKAISIAVKDKSMASEYVFINEEAEKIYDLFLPGAITVISKSRKIVDHRMESENENLGIRIPNYKLIIDILNEFGRAITSTSANSSGEKTPYKISDIFEHLSQKQISLIDLVIDVGELPKNPPSTVIDTTTSELTTYRSGRINPKLFKSEIFISNSVDDTIKIGYDFAQKILGREKISLVLLDGEMGAGKTHFVKGVGTQLGIKKIIKSPSYNYVNEHKTLEGKIMYHFDAWRIQNKNDLDNLNFYSWFKNENIILIEWPSIVMEIDPIFFEDRRFILVEFSVNTQTKRTIRIVTKKE